ncbi:unnamed protein product [Caenorhabditis sp. 36 PRJEB53466]|nr:unnamed protein product [Caenorhabditis sp. 36 PRJEB53466]
MEGAWSVFKSTATPILLGPKKFSEMCREKQNEAIRDASFRVVLLFLFPYFFTMLFSFAVGVSSGMLINEVIVRSLGSEEKHKTLRRYTVVLGGSALFATTALCSLHHVITPFFKFLCLGFRWFM